MRLRLGIDLDGVVADFNAGWISRYNRDFGTGLTVADVVEWDAPVGLTHFVTMGEFWSWARTCADGRSIFHGLDPYDGAIEALVALSGVGHRIVVLTTKPRFAVDDTHEWLARHRVPNDEVHILEDKAAVDCDVYLDYADHNLTALRDQHTTATVCRYVRQWNNPVDGTVDVTDWAEFTTVVRDLTDP